MSIAVIVNPAARSSAAALRVLRRQALRLARPLIVFKTTPDHSGAKQARQALELKAEEIIVVGGDGTLRQVAGVLGGTGVPLGVMPTGTGNIFGRNLGLRPHQHECNARIALAGAVRFVDLGWVKINNRVMQPFLVMVGLGRDVEVVEAVETVGRASKRLLGWRAYAKSGLAKMFADPMQFDLPERTILGWTLLVGNVPIVPSGARIFPRVQLNSGDLEVLAVGRPNFVDWIGIAAYGLHLSNRTPHLSWWRTGRFDATLPEPRNVQVDGDLVSDVTQVTISVDASALSVRGAPTCRVRSNQMMRLGRQRSVQRFVGHIAP